MLPRTRAQMRLILALAVLALPACKTTPEKQAAAPGKEPGPDIEISADELEPMESFLSQTRRVVVAQLVRVEMTPQFFESRMGFTRDLRYVRRTQTDLPDGSRMIEFTNINAGQETNHDGDLLPRLYFGAGLEVRAIHTLRLYLRSPKDRLRPLFLEIVAKNSSGNAKLWVAGRLETEQPTIRVRSELLWSEEKERYVHKAFLG